MTFDNALWLVFAALVVAGWRSSTNHSFDSSVRLVGLALFWGPASWILIFKGIKALFL